MVNIFLIVGKFILEVTLPRTISQFGERALNEKSKGVKVYE